MLAFSGRPTALVPRDGTGQAKPSPLALGVGDGGTVMARILAQLERPVEVGKDEGSHFPRLSEAGSGSSVVTAPVCWHLVLLPPVCGMGCADAVFAPRRDS